MKLQICFEDLELNEALKLAKKISNFCDTIEIGNSLLLEYGIKVVEKFRKKIKDKNLLLDTRFTDSPISNITKKLYQEGADWLTVMSNAPKPMIHHLTTLSKNNNKKVMMDMLNAISAGQIAMEAKTLGVDAILIKHRVDEDEIQFIDKWEMVSGNSNLPIYISTECSDIENIKKIISLNPAGIVIGKSITHSEDPEKIASHIYEFCKANNLSIS